MTELLDKLRAAEEGSRELDCCISAELEDREVFFDGNTMMGRSRTPPHDQCVLGWIDPGKQARNFQAGWAKPPWPHYTTSIDAALTLVPEGWIWKANWFNSKGYALVGKPSEKGNFKEPHKYPALAKTPALALCIAALTAREKEETT